MARVGLTLVLKRRPTTVPLKSRRVLIHAYELYPVLIQVKSLSPVTMTSRARRVNDVRRFRTIREILKS